jgi:Family of unknown function (DUF5343)
MGSLPYLATPGTIRNALERIKAAATPPRVTGDFVSTILRIKGGAGAVIPSFLKKIGFVASDGTPTELYKRFRNGTNGGAAVAEAIKYGYRELSQANEYFYKLPDKALQDLILQVTGAPAGSSVARLTFATLKHLKSFADFDPDADAMDMASASAALPAQQVERPPAHRADGVGLNLSYTINLNLPATSDQAVFNAIFRSLKEHLLSNAE